MPFPNKKEISNALKELSYLEPNKLLRGSGIWHVFQFLRFCVENGGARRQSLSSFSLTDFAFETTGVQLPEKHIDQSGDLYFEPFATGGSELKDFFRKFDAPRNVFLNRIQTGLSGNGPRQPNIFKVHSQQLPCDVELNVNWIEELRSFGQNSLILDTKANALFTWLFRFGYVEDAEGTGFSPFYGNSDGYLTHRSTLNYIDVNSPTEIKATFCKVFGIQEKEFDQLFPMFDDQIKFTWSLSTPESINDIFTDIQTELFPTTAGLKPINLIAKSSTSELSDTNELWKQFERQFQKGFKNFMFSGPPGTGKSWYARKVAEKLTGGQDSQIAMIQFHPSFNYDDFVLGYVPSANGSEKNGLSFELKEKVFLKTCEQAKLDETLTMVLIIDELNRGDAARIFGEFLTYIEESYRGSPVSLAYTSDIYSVPDNLIIIATMNPTDRSISEIDDAFSRRFKCFEIPPSAVILTDFLTKNSVDRNLTKNIVNFFEEINDLTNGEVGHTIFKDVHDKSDLRDVWDFNLKNLLKKKFQFEPDNFSLIEQKFEELLR